MTITSHQHALAPGIVLMEYRLAGLLGAGAFGITYLARDIHLDKDVAIKEYLPSAFAARAGDGTVVPVTQQQAQEYRWGLDRFSKEARTLARFSHPNIVRVIRYFEANATGYMVMDYEQGQPLKSFAQAHPFPSEGRLRAMLMPLLDGLEKVHAAGFLHRDIKPDNIYLRADGAPVLIDFGSARQTAGETGQPFTTILTPGYAPFEQYTTSKKQGPWSDIYSLGGVLYFLVTGNHPSDAITRMKGDTLPEQLGTALSRYSPPLIEAIAWALALDEGARPADIASWRSALLISQPADRDATPSSIGIRSLRVEPVVRTEAGDVAGMVATRNGEPTHTTLRIDAAPELSAAERAMPVQSCNRLLGDLLLAAVCAVVSGLLARLAAFQDTHIISTKLTAASLSQLLGTGGVVFFFWLFGRRIALRFRAQGGAHMALCDLLTPIVTLAALGLAYLTLQRPIAGLLDEKMSSAYSLIFFLATCGCAVWTSMAVFSHAEPLRRLLQHYRSSPAPVRSNGSA